MVQLLYPIGLLAAAGIIVPVVIHLWNIKTGKTLKIGSISLLGVSSSQRSRNFRVTGWPLLLLRCLLLILVAVLLAVPLWNTRPGGSAKPGWILLEKQELGQVWKENRKEIDALLKKGYELRDFNTGFSRIELHDTSTVFSAPGHPLSYFSLIRQLNSQQVNTVYLYTNAHLNRFEGTRPAVNFRLNWKFFRKEKEEVTWTAGNVNLTQDRVRKLIAHSSAEGTYYQQEDQQLSAGQQASAGSALRTDTGRIAEAGKIEVLIYGNGQQADVTYLRAAVLAIADFTERKIEWKEISSLAQVTKKTNLVFWLSDPGIVQLKKLPAGVSFFNYAGHQPEKIKSVLRYETGTATHYIALYQRTKFDERAVKSVWNDGFGKPLLTLDTTGHIRHYQFYSRFNQQWTDLVWDNGLVMALLPVIIPHKEDDFGFAEDRRAVRTVGAVPKLSYHGEKNDTHSVIPDGQRPLSTLFCWLALVTFFIERILTYRKIERKI